MKNALLPRRTALTGIAASLVLGTQSEAQTIVGLRKAADEARVLFGSAVRDKEIADPRHRQLYIENCNVICAFDQHQWYRRDAPRGEIQAQELVDFARTNKQKIRWHCLLWDYKDRGDYWVFGKNEAQLCEHGGTLAIQQGYETYIRNTLATYGEHVYVWDILNEPLTKKACLYPKFGPAYMASVIEWMRSIVPHQLLLINFDNAEYDRHMQTQIVAFLSGWGRASPPPFVVGIQSHLWLKAGFVRKEFTDFLNAVRDLGFRIWITELDVNTYGVHPPLDRPQALEDQAASILEFYLKTVLHNDAVDAIMFWGLCDDTHYLNEVQPWRKDKFSTGLSLFDGDLKMKPTGTWLQEELSARGSHPT
jgi:endo-1,4-beta-xylanase